MKLFRHAYWIIYLLFVLSCARVSSPTGGPKDTIPPRLIESSPADQQLNFRGKEIALTFNELVILNNPKEQLIVTPTIGKDYDISVRNTKVILQYETTLQDSTTYTFNFREAVQDITEKNPARNLKLAISTGSYIDSLIVQGTIMNALTEKPFKDATVALQPYTDTFEIFKHPATYFTRTNEQGAYSIENLKHGTYSLYAFSDPNKNLTVDSKSEIYGFKALPIKLDSITKNLNINLVKLDMRPLKLTAARPYNTYFNIRTSKNIKSFKVATKDSVDLYAAYGSDRANVYIYNTLINQDSLQISFSAEDSVNNKIDTTFWMKFSPRQATPEKFSYELQNPRLFAHKGELSMKIKFSKPLKEIDFDSLVYQVDSLTTITFNKDNVDYSEHDKLLTIKKPVDKKLFELPAQNPLSQPDTTQPAPLKKLNQLNLGKGAFISVEQDSSEAKTETLQPLQLENLGLISAYVTNNTLPVIIQLLDTKGNVIKQAVHKTQASFDDLLPADYVLRIIIDTNKNGLWDPGNYYLKEEPEQIHYYKNEKDVREIKLKANFEIGPLLITY